MASLLHSPETMREANSESVGTIVLVAAPRLLIFVDPSTSRHPCQERVIQSNRSDAIDRS